jgi:hypothetical protein
MNKMVDGLIFWGIAALLVWAFYSMSSGAKGGAGFIDSDRVAYRKGVGVIVEKQATQAQYELKFTYPEESNSYNGSLIVSQKEFDKAQVGDKIPIYYGIHLPHLWMPVKSGKVYYISILLLVLAAILFLVGGFLIYRAAFGAKSNQVTLIRYRER